MGGMACIFRKVTLGTWTQCTLTFMGGMACICRKVHPGYSMFDWNKLCNSGEVDMTGTRGKMLRVSPEELAKHRTDSDLWTSVRGK